MIRDQLLIFLTDLIYFGFPNGLQVYWARQKKTGEVTIRLKQFPHPMILRCGTSDFIVFDQVFKSREYNIDIPVSERGYVIDAGANIGLASIYFINKYPHCKIIALEPEDSNYGLLIRNTEFYPSITCVKKALWHEHSTLYLGGDRNDKWGFTVTINKNETHAVEAISVTELRALFNISEIEIFKIDIEGAEKEIFSFNYEPWLPAVKTIVIEFHDGFRPGSAKAFFNAVLPYNFLFKIKGEKIIATRPDQETFSQ